MEKYQQKLGFFKDSLGTLKIMVKAELLLDDERRDLRRLLGYLWYYAVTLFIRVVFLVFSPVLFLPLTYLLRREREKEWVKAQRRKSDIVRENIWGKDAD